jgi:hypothetical protein
MERMLRRLIGESMQLVAKRAPELGPVKADPGQIGHVILNLVVSDVRELDWAFLQPMESSGKVKAYPVRKSRRHVNAVSWLRPCGLPFTNRENDLL